MMDHILKNVYIHVYGSFEESLSKKMETVNKLDFVWFAANCVCFVSEMLKWIKDGGFSIINKNWEWEIEMERQEKEVRSSKIVGLNFIGNTSSGAIWWSLQGTVKWAQTFKYSCHSEQVSDIVSQYQFPLELTSYFDGDISPFWPQLVIACIQIQV